MSLCLLHMSKGTFSDPAAKMVTDLGPVTLFHYHLPAKLTTSVEWTVGWDHCWQDRLVRLKQILQIIPAGT